jgi:hypothetical protein
MGTWGGSAAISGVLHCVHGGIVLWRMAKQGMFGFASGCYS